MKIVTEARQQRDPATRVYGTSPLHEFLMVLLVTGVLIGMGYGAVAVAPELPGLVWVLAAPLGLLSLLIVLLVWSAVIGSFFASLRSTNWLARITPRGLELNLRSYRNARPGDALPVVQLELSEIAFVRRRKETWIEEKHDGRTHYRRNFIELHLDGVDTSALAEAVRTEVDHLPAETKRFGVRSRAKHHHVPVAVQAPGVLRVEWQRALFERLRTRVRVEESQHVILDRELESVDTLTRARALGERGARLQAIRLLMDESGLTRAEARARLARESDDSQEAA